VVQRRPAIDRCLEGRAEGDVIQRSDADHGLKRPTAVRRTFLWGCSGSGARSYCAEVYSLECAAGPGLEAEGYSNDEIRFELRGSLSIEGTRGR
jgi:hypothetical protein